MTVLDGLVCSKFKFKAFISHSQHLHCNLSAWRSFHSIFITFTHVFGEHLCSRSYHSEIIKSVLQKNKKFFQPAFTAKCYNIQTHVHVKRNRSAHHETLCHCFTLMLFWTCMMFSQNKVFWRRFVYVFVLSYSLGCKRHGPAIRPTLTVIWHGFLKTLSLSHPKLSFPVAQR